MFIYGIKTHSSISFDTGRLVLSSQKASTLVHTKRSFSLHFLCLPTHGPPKILKEESETHTRNAPTSGNPARFVCWSLVWNCDFTEGRNVHFYESIMPENPRRKEHAHINSVFISNTPLRSHHFLSYNPFFICRLDYSLHMFVIQDILLTCFHQDSFIPSNSKLKIGLIWVDTSVLWDKRPEGSAVPERAGLAPTSAGSSSRLTITCHMLQPHWLPPSSPHRPAPWCPGPFHVVFFAERIPTFFFLNLPGNCQLPC